MKKTIFILFALIISLFSFKNSFASQLGLTNLERACLPVVGRMQKGEAAACHCPPQKLCPLDADEWNEAKFMPQSITNVCCDRPKTCATTTVVLLACGRNSYITQKKDSFCWRFQMKSDNYNSPAYQAANSRMISLESQITIYRTQIISLTTGPETPQTFAQVVNILNVIHALEGQMKNIEQETNVKGSGVKIDIKCADESKVNLCTSHVSSPCPPPPDPDPNPNCRISGIGFGRMTSDEKAAFLKRCPNPEFYDCVAEGTLVMMADGSQKPIQEVRIGEYIKGYSANNRVTGLSLEEEGAAFLMSINDGKINITPQHPIMTSKGWKAIYPDKVNADEDFKATISKLEVGDEILIPDEGVITVNKISGYEGPKVTTYNLSVNGDKTFIANGMVIRAFKKNDRY